MKIKNIIHFLESVAPPAYQESYDNAGLIVGNPKQECTKVLLCLDSTEQVIDEAIEEGCQLVIAHHPIVFSGLKKITGKNYIERVIIKAIKNDIAIYAAHTNLDNVRHGVNQKICERLGLVNSRILAPKKQILNKISFLCPIAQVEIVRKALFDAGAGDLDTFSTSSFNMLGISTANDGHTMPNGDFKVEMVFPAYQKNNILNTLMKVHPHETISYQIIQLENAYPNVGSGMIGDLEEPMAGSEFLVQLKEQMNAACIRHTRLLRKKVKRVAVCGGAGSFLLAHAIRQKADVFVTADYKYHQFFDAEDQLIIADIGHYESEQFTIELFYELITNKFSTFEVILTQNNTNPVKYLV